MCRDPIITEAPGGPVVNLRRYGWVASPEENFSDDGAYFTAYRYYPNGYNPDEESNFRLTRTNYEGDTFISIRYRNPLTGRNVYIDDLNGVPRQTAVDKFPEVMEKVKALYDREKSEEGPAVRNLNDDEVAQVKDLIVKIMDLTDASVWKAYEQAIKKMGLNKEDIPDSVERGIIKSVVDDFRNSQSYGKEAVQKLASAYLKDVMAKMRSGYTSGGKWKNGYDLEKALSSASAMIEDPTGRKTYIHLSDLSDKLQQKIKAWARNRIETLYDFDDDEE